MRWQAQRDTALDFSTPQIQSAVAARPAGALQGLDKLDVDDGLVAKWGVEYAAQFIDI